jgi:hypothetical protein
MSGLLRVNRIDRKKLHHRDTEEAEKREITAC